MCILIVFGVVITNKKNNFTTRSDRDQRQIKEIADTLLIFNLSFMQEKKTYIWVSKHVVSPLKRMKYHGFVRFQRGIDFSTVK